MKYQYQNQAIPQSKRKELNEKILYLIDQNLAEESGITREDIFSAYTGDGGLHGLNRNDFSSFYEYSQAKKEIEHGQFFSPPGLCEFVMEALQPGINDTVADMTCGMGNFCNYMPLEANFYGCELDIKAWKVAHYLYPGASIVHGDIRHYTPGTAFDYIVGNPPFNLTWDTDQGRESSQMYYCLKAARHLKPLGLMGIVIPAAFLGDRFTNRSDIEAMEAQFSYLGQVELTGNFFRYFGISHSTFPTKVMFWQKKLNADSEGNPYRLEYDAELKDLEHCGETLQFVREKLIVPAKELQRQQGLQVKRSMLGKPLCPDPNHDPAFEYKVQKMLYHIRANPKLQDKYAKCQEYLYSFQTQMPTPGMSDEEWQKIKITEAKVLAYLRRVIQSQNKKPARDIVRLVRQSGGLVYKAYSARTRRSLTEEAKTQMPFYRIVSEHYSADKYGNFARMIRRKQRNYDQETKPFPEMELRADLTQYLEEFTVYDAENDEQIHLNEMQKHDLNLVLQKRYHLLQWEQGSGKTLAGIAVGQYRMKYQGARNAWVVSTAISIKNNWVPVLQSYGIAHRMVARLSDLDAVQDGEFVLITLNALSKYRKQVKKHIRIRNQKICLLLDESDEMTNPSGKRTKAILECFRRARFKLAMTGTSTRNNISEIATQLELLYNNSYNMLSWVPVIYRRPRKESDIVNDRGFVEDKNPYYGKPIPAYKKGYTLFSQSHLPDKLTVFGVKQQTQDIYQADILSEMLSYMIQTRTFEEITGKDLRRIHQVTVNFSPEEERVYGIVCDEFERIKNQYFSEIEDKRKESLLKLVRIITLLLRVSAAPNTMAEYRSERTPVKIEKVMSMVTSWPEEIVVIGVRHKNVVEAYASEIRKRFPDRQLFVVTGETTTLTQRKALQKTLRESKNGILLCTQQSLSASVNFEFVNKVIIPELHYNNARMSQFYMRFVRYTSQNWKDIYFVTYAGSIESNLMQMVVAKEKLNLFMKGQDVDLDEVYEKFGITYDLMSLLMTRETDSHGKSFFRWGSQNIS